MSYGVWWEGQEGEEWEELAASLAGGDQTVATSYLELTEQLDTSISAQLLAAMLTGK